MADSKYKDRDLFTVKKRKSSKFSVKRKKKKADSDDEWFADPKKQEKEKSNVYIEPLSYAGLMDGLITLGCISKITQYYLEVSLPYRLSGRVSISRISHAYTALLKEITKKEDGNDAEVEVMPLESLFKVGQHVATKVESVAKMKKTNKVNLTLIPQEINFGLSAPKLKEGIVLPCAVASVEDNGYVMETGISSVRAAFMNRAQTEGAGILGVGSIVRCIIIQAQHSEDKKTVQIKLSAVPSEVNDAVLDVLDTDDFSLLIPGTAVKSIISNMNRRCIKLLLAEFDGVIGPQHLSTPLDVLHNYKVGQEVTARVIYITPLSRVIHLTLQKDIFVLKSEDELLHGLKIGDKKQGIAMDREPRGVNFKFGNCKGYCPNRRLRDSTNDKINVRADFPPGSEHELCIISYCYFDQNFIVTLQKSVMREQTVGINALTAGQILMATIRSYKEDRAIASVATKVEGWIPLVHLTNTIMDHPEKKYPVGSTVKVRILEVFPKRHRLIFTCKKLLVHSKGAVVSEYNKELENQVADGIVAKVYPKGLLVVFYNQVKGFVPKSLAWAGNINDLAKQFKIGDVVKTKILLVTPEEQKMTLSLLLDEELSIKNPEKPLTKSSKLLCVNDFVRCIVKGIEENCIKVRIRPANLRAEIPNHHLADDARRCVVVKKMLRVGDEIQNVVVFQMDSHITLSLKDSICRWIHRTKNSARNQFKESHCYPAVVSEIIGTEVKVKIPVGKSGQDVTIDANADSVEALVVGQSIDVKCEGFHESEENGPILSIHSKHNKRKKRTCLQELYSHLQYQRLLQMNKVRKGFLSDDFSFLQIGHKLNVEVMAISPLGLLVKNESGTIPGIILNEHCPSDVKYEIGSKLKACILHVHAKEKCLILTARSDLVKILHTEAEPKIKVGQQVRCEVLFVKKKFIVVRLKSRGKGLISYIPFTKKAAVSKNINITIKFVQGTYIFGITKAQENWGLFPVNGKVPLINLISSAADIGEKGKYVELINIISSAAAVGEKRKYVDNFRQYSLKKIKKVAFLSSKKTKIEAETEIEVKTNIEAKEETAAIMKVSKKVKKKKEGKEEDIGNNEVEKTNKDSNTKPKKRKQEESKSSEESSMRKKKKEKSDGNKDKCSTKEETKGEDSFDSGVDENMNSDDDLPKITDKSKPCLKVGTGFVWDVPENEGNRELESSSDEEDEADAAKKKKTKKLSRVEREMLAKEEEKRLHDLERTRLEKERLPQSVLDYEELLQQSPNSSAVWIQFISFYLENAEVDQARSVAQRALQMINIEEYEERINVWTVLLRLEVLYGTEESTEAAYKEALATNDPLKIYLAMAMVYAESNKLKEAENTYFKMTKKFSHVFDVWIKAGIFFYKNSRLEDARKYMERGLLSLDKTEHVNLINRFSQLEFQFGEVERARTMFESLLSNYPIRMDIWSVYVDMMGKKGDIEGARQVLERMTNLKLRLKRMRFVFKKFVEFEKQHGTPQTVAAVKKRVEDYIAASLQQD